ncbi:MAG: DUF4337 domain-containing protein [Syntrophobacter sp.]
MAEEKKEPWLNYLALTTVIFAVCATLSTFKGGSYSTRSILNQSLATNQWAYYQAKSLKGYLYEIQKESLEADLQQKGEALPPALLEEQKERVNTYAKRIARYDSEKADIQKVAKGFEDTRDDAQRHSQIFGIAVIFLQIAILLSSIAALMKKKIVWMLGVLFGIAGIVYFANGFFVFFT